MEPLFFSLSLFLPIVSFAFIFHLYTSISKPQNKTNLPPGSFGWPLIGETYQFLSQDPQIFIKDRITKYSSKIFKTSLFGDPVVVLCGPSGHKFISANEGKLMTIWRPVSMQKLFRGSYQKVSSSTTISSQSGARLIRSSALFKPEALAAFAEVMDSMAKSHFEEHWIGKSEVEVCGLVQLLIAGVAAKLFVGLEDPQRVANIARFFDLISQGLHAFPYSIPGTSFARAKKASDAMRNEILMVIKQKKTAMPQGEKLHDYLSYMIFRGDHSGRFMPENEVADKVMGLAFAAFSSPSLALMYLMKYLGEKPQVYEEIRAGIL
ncbi:hypothetical protein L6164_001643 [Bauhinia variegata]|uniref:Uncharacterized protein n=1 Tax=Bauhinia variegata TaxID=167791 RepID=A0ACB9QHB6_BAUVA|nr:hypothetical protein L6164_001643 [Bauhinia variegata]